MEVGETKKNCDNPCCKINPIQLAVIGAFLTVVGDFITFISVLITAQGQYGTNVISPQSEKIK